MINGFLVYHREEKKHEACMLNIKAQAVKDVVLKKLKDRFQRQGMTLQDYLMSTRKSSTAALTLRDFCKVWPDICSHFLFIFWFLHDVTMNLITGTIIMTFIQCLKHWVLYIDSCHSCFQILDDCGIFLEGLQFQMLIESLGFNLGPISVTDFVAKFEGLIYNTQSFYLKG